MANVLTDQNGVADRRNKKKHSDAWGVWSLGVVNVQMIIVAALSIELITT